MKVFPSLEKRVEGSCGVYDVRYELVGGMTLRNWFAGQAMIGLLISHNLLDQSAIAQFSYEQADAMMKASEL